MLVSEDSFFNLSLKLSNSGDDSYNTSLTMFYPLGLSFSRMTQVSLTSQEGAACFGAPSLREAR